MVPVSRPVRLALYCAAALALTLALSISVRADAVNFADTTDTVVGTTTGARASIVTVAGQQVCGFQTIDFEGSAIAAEGCVATITATSPLATLNGGNHLYLVTDGSVFSDAIAITQLTPGLVEVTFLSDANVAGQEPGLPVTCAKFDGVCSTLGEVGSISVDWSNGVTDTVTYESDTESVVPEPASLTLLGSGILAIAGFLKKRLA